jgi:hypothetical protein
VTRRIYAKFVLLSLLASLLAIDTTATRLTELESSVKGMAQITLTNLSVTQTGCRWTVRSADGAYFSGRIPLNPD